MNEAHPMLMLKQMRLVGFKSFADEVVFDFTGGMTVIVGPNGCGKTNLVDAVKWSLGEQSAKSLRGGQIGDVIFSGTRSRPAQNMAEVSLLFDNNQRYFARDEAEISISRRLFRNGQSEYLINGEKTRLKDVQELLMDTGIGTSNYSLIEQGRVDWLINSRPLERRIVLEEAAGVSKFKSRRDEALRKLEATSRNLERVDDIIAEVKSRKNSLKRQATKAERFQREKDRYLELQRRWHFHEYHELRGEMDTVGLKEREARQRVEKIGTEISRRESLVAEKNTSATELERLLREQASKNTEVQRRHQDLDKEKAVLLADLRTCTESRGRSKETIQRLETRLEELDKEKEALLAKAKELEQEKENTLSEMKEQKTQVDELVRAIDSSRGELQAEQDKLLDGLAEETRLRNAVEDSERQVLRLSAELDRQISLREERAAEFSSLSQKIETVRRSLEEIRERKERVEGQVEEAAEALTESERKLAECEQALRMKSEAIHAEESRGAVLKDTIESLEGYGAGVKSVIQSSQEGKLPQGDVLGVLGELLDVEDGLERAVEAALEEELQCVVVKDLAAADRAVERLTSNDAGRASFLPLREISELQERVSEEGFPPDLPQGAVCWLTERVGGPDELRPMIQFLLKRFVLVEEGPLVPYHPKEGIGYVSLSGSKWSPSGRRTGGAARDPSAGFIQRRGQLDRVAQQLTVLRSEMSGLEKDRSQWVSSREERALRLSDRRSALHDMEVEGARMEKELEQWQANHERLASELRLRAEEIGSTERERNEETGKGKQSEERLKERIGENQRTRECMDQLREKLRSEEEQHRGAEAKWGELRVSWTRVDELLKGQDQGRQRLEAAEADCAAGIQEAQQEIERTRAEEERLGERTEKIDKELERLLGEREEGESKIGELEEKRKGEMKLARDEEENLKRDRSVLKSVSEQLHAHEMALSEFRLKADGIVKRLREDFDVEGPPEQYPKHSSIGNKPLQEEIDRLKKSIDAMGPVNLLAIEEYEELNKRFEFLNTQRQDLTASRASLEELIQRIDARTRSLLGETWSRLQQAFSDSFKALFMGGEARLVMVGSEDILEAGIGIEAQPPGKHLQSITLLSGGEKAMTAIAFLFSLLTVKSCPLCILDEVDAPLDEENTVHFLKLLRSFMSRSQFLVISHNRLTMESGDTLYGVTMKEEGVTTTVSVRLKEESAAAGG